MHDRPTSEPAASGAPVTAHWPLAAGVAFSALFTALTWALGDRLATVPHLPDAGPSWYYWKLAEPTALTRGVVWSLYAAHQLFSWGTIAWAQRAKLSTTAGLHKVNVVALVGNALFALLHLAQTHVTYDGLAQDVHVFSSLASVAILLIWVLLMETPRRGLFFGARVPLPEGLVPFARRTHGYYFSWAIIYTFWFHPTEPTNGHLAGFFYILLILVQGSLFFTRAHLNRWWTLALEVLVLVHGTRVAMDQSFGLAPMFFFGFGGIFVITQMHGLGWSRAVRGAVLAAYLGGAVWVYAGRGLAHLNEPFRIPIIDYLGVFILVLLLWGPMVVAKRLKARSTSPAR